MTTNEWLFLLVVIPVPILILLVSIWFSDRRLGRPPLTRLTENQLDVSPGFDFEPSPPHFAQRIFAGADSKFVSRQSLEIQLMLRLEHQQLSLAWLGQTRMMICGLAEWHWSVARRHFRLGPALELKLVRQFIYFRSVCVALNWIIRLRGPVAASRLANYTAALAHQLFNHYTSLLIEMAGSFTKSPRDELENLEWSPEITKLNRKFGEINMLESRIECRLAEIDSRFGQLAFLAQACRRTAEDDAANTNRADQQFNRHSEKINFILLLNQDHLFKDLAFCPLESCVSDLVLYLGSMQIQPSARQEQWSQSETYRQLIPKIPHNPLLDEMFLSNVRASLALLQAERQPSHLQTKRK